MRSGLEISGLTAGILATSLLRTRRKWFCSGTRSRAWSGHSAGHIFRANQGNTRQSLMHILCLWLTPYLTFAVHRREGQTRVIVSTASRRTLSNHRTLVPSSRRKASTSCLVPIDSLAHPPPPKLAWLLLDCGVSHQGDRRPPPKGHPGTLQAPFLCTSSLCWPAPAARLRRYRAARNIVIFGVVIKFGVRSVTWNHSYLRKK